MKEIAILKRDSTKITISEFYERYNMGKYNLSPSYQRRGDVWDEDKKGFLIDTILKNYPIPPIFLHQRIDEETGSTMYDVIDGKQRLTAIVDFLTGKLSLPQNYDEGAYGDSRLNGITISDLDGELFEYKRQLWRYAISVEYIDTNDLDIVDNIFDRLNRNGEPLEMQELRLARYHDTKLMNLVNEVVGAIDWENVGKIKTNRMQDQEFASELLFYLLDEGASDGNSKKVLDEKYRIWDEKLTDDLVDSSIRRTKQIVAYLKEIEIDFDRFNLKGVSHYYALFGFCNKMVELNLPVTLVRTEITRFFEMLRDEKICDTNEYTKAYKDSMTSNTKSKTQRMKRINALVNYMCVANSL